MPSPYRLTATQVLELLKNNTLTAEAYARSLLDRIQARDSTVKAWAYVGKPTPCLFFSLIAPRRVPRRVLISHQIPSSYSARHELWTRSLTPRGDRCTEWR